MRFHTRWLFGAALVAFQGCSCEGCDPTGLNQVPPQQLQADEFCQRPSARVDVLWVVDNSGSMTAEQNKIADKFFEFFRQLRVSLVDYHIGVITTSIQEGLQEDSNGILRQYAAVTVAGGSPVTSSVTILTCAETTARAPRTSRIA
jgi:hypothetical protein